MYSRELLLFYFSLLQVSTALPDIETDKSSCKLQTVGGILNIKNQLAPGRLLYSGSNSKDLCQSLCCDTESCTNYVWHTTGHCFLLECLSGKKCQIVANENAETGFVYHGTKNVPHDAIPLRRDKQDESHGEISDVSKENLQGVSSQEGRKQVSQLEKDSGQHHSVSAKKYKMDSASKQMHAQEDGRAVNDGTVSNKRVAGHKKTKLVKLTEGQDTSKREPSNRKDFSTQDDDDSKTIDLSTLNTTEPGKSPNVKRKASHTTTTSLIAALFFGLIFLIAVLFLIGKRWYENMTGSSKGGYSRVSFLMNGM